jgi:hypothetical protein
MPALDKDEIARLTEQYGGEWGINHTRRLLHLVELRRRSGSPPTCMIGARTPLGRKRMSTTCCARSRWRKAF